MTRPIAMHVPLIPPDESATVGFSAPPTATASRLRARDGFTIVEIIVAIMVLAVGVLGLASTAAVVQKQMARGERHASAAAIAQGRFDELTSVNCHTLTGAKAVGTATYRNGQVKEGWTVTDEEDVKRIDVTITIAGRKNALVYTTYIPCRD